MTESILVGVTGSAASRRAAAWAARRAYDRHARIELISIVGGAVGAVGEGSVLDALLQSARRTLDGVAENLREGGLTVDTRIGRGDPVGEIVDASMLFDLLVIGGADRGRSAASDRYSHGPRIAAGAHCSVAVVPDMDIASRHGVVVGVDGSVFSARALEFAAVEAARTGEKLTAITAWSPLPLPLGMHEYPPSYIDGMQRLARETLDDAVAGVTRLHTELEVVRVVERGHPAAIIARHAETARIVVVGSRGHGALARLLVGSTSQEVLDRLGTVAVVVR